LNPIQNKAYKFKGSDTKLITADLTYANHPNPVPICVFAHGFKGFKDWGAWPLAAEIFALKQLPFLKFNFSHNGTSPSHLSDFVDLEAFGNNNFKKEYDELGMVFDFIEKKASSFDFEWNKEIYLIGHSRGGGIALIRAANDIRVTKCATWAGVSDFKKFVNLQNQNEWQQDGKRIVINARTDQEMPMYYQFVESFLEHHELLNIEEALEKITCPLLVVHGEEDTTIPLSDAHTIFNEVGHSIMVEIENADHTFNTKHPLEERKISKAFAEAVTETIEFFAM
jgi:pimeloyl-ACP methyl ester carboxylesterase